MASHLINQDKSEQPYLHSFRLQSLPFLHALKVSVNLGKIFDMTKYQKLYIAFVG